MQDSNTLGNSTIESLSRKGKNIVSRKIYIIIASILAILMLGTAAYLIYNKVILNKSKSNTNTSTQTSESNTSSTEVQGSDHTTSDGQYTQTGGTKTEENKTYTASGTDQSAILVNSSAKYTLTNASISSKSNTSSNDNSSFYGLNAAVLVEGGSTMTLSESVITTNGKGANGAFATGSGSSLTLTNVTINASGQGAHAVMTTQGGVLVLNNVNMNTTDVNSGAIATDRGGGAITVNGGITTTSGQDSPGIYSTGAITVNNAQITAAGAEAAVIEGSNNITLNSVDLTTTKTNKWGIMIYQSMSGDATGANGTFTMTKGSLTTTSTSPLFYITNTTANISLNKVTITNPSGTLIKATSGNWGTSGSNGGNANLTADNQVLDGNIVTDKISTVSLSLKNGSSYTGAINTANTAKSISVTLDSASSWVVTANSYITTFSDTDGISGTTITNITGNGHTIYYKSSANSSLGGKTYTLVGGGNLKPV